MEALLNAAREVLTRQQAHTSIPKRLTLMIREIWHMQPQLQHPTRKRALWTLENRRFRAAYDFFLLRNEVAEPELSSLCEWWTDIQTKTAEQQKALCDALQNNNQKKPAKRRKRRRKKVHSESNR